MKKFNTMNERVQYYLDYRRALGYKLHIEGSELLRFANYVDCKNYHGALTKDLAIEWASSSKKSTRHGWARRLEIVCCFAKFFVAYEPETEIPTNGIFGSAHQRKTPHIYSYNEIQQLLDATNILLPKDGLRPISFRFLFGLLYAAGLRISEALSLTVKDVNLKEAIVMVNQTKFHKSRLVPLDESTIKALNNYCKIREKYINPEKSSAFFIIDNGNHISYRAAQYAFSRLRKSLGWNNKIQGRLPRIYDLRHTFVCHRILAWYEEGIDVLELMPQLSTYLGHVKVSDTYWYITGIPQLMRVVGKRFERYAQNKTEGGLK